jgi:RNA polymerase sigma-B factor
MFRELEGLVDSTAQFQRQRDRIVERCLPLADHIARRFDGRGEPRDDLVQVARVGLVNAVIRFDVNAGSDFVSFAVPTIMGEVRRHFRDNSWSVKVPRRLKELHLRLGAATADLSQRLGRAPTASELATELDMDRDEVIEGLVAGSSYNTLSTAAAAAATRMRLRSPTRSAMSIPVWIRSRTEKRCGPCSLRYQSVSGRCCCCGFSSR